MPRTLTDEEEITYNRLVHNDYPVAVHDRDAAVAALTKVQADLDRVASSLAAERQMYASFLQQLQANIAKVLTVAQTIQTTAAQAILNPDAQVARRKQLEAQHASIAAELEKLQ